MENNIENNIHPKRNLKSNNRKERVFNQSTLVGNFKKFT